MKVTLKKNKLKEKINWKLYIKLQTLDFFYGAFLPFFFKSTAYTHNHISSYLFSGLLLE